MNPVQYHQYWITSQTFTMFFQLLCNFVARYKITFFTPQCWYICRIRICSSVYLSLKRAAVLVALTAHDILIVERWQCIRQDSRIVSAGRSGAQCPVRLKSDDGRMRLSSSTFVPVTLSSIIKEEIRVVKIKLGWDGRKRTFMIQFRIRNSVRS